MMYSFYYLEEWRQYIRTHSRTLYTTLNLTNLLVADLESKGILTTYQCQSILAIPEPEKINRALKFIDCMRYDVTSVRLQNLIPLLDEHDWAVAANLVQHFYQSMQQPNGPPLPMEPPSPKNDQVQTVPQECTFFGYRSDGSGKNLSF